MQFIPSCESTNFSTLGSRSTTQSPRLRPSTWNVQSQWVLERMPTDLALHSHCREVFAPRDVLKDDEEEVIVVDDFCFDQPRSFALCSEIDFSSLRQPDLDDFEPDEPMPFLPPATVRLAHVCEYSPSYYYPTDDTASSPESDITDAFPTDRYVKLGSSRSFLGRGSAGFVYCGLDLETCEVVALKETPIGYRDGTAQLENEIAICRELGDVHSQHFVHVIEGGISKTMLTTVAPFMNGGTLRQFIARCAERSSRMKESVIRHIALQIIEGLSILHKRQQPIIHNDLKPENILLTERGDARICDFGLSRKLKSRTDSIEDFRGTMVYFAPEKFGKFNYQVDVWALGIILYECVVGHPIPRLSVGTVGRSGFRPPLKDLECVSLGLRDLILSCFVEDYTLRPTAAQLLEHPFLQHVPRDKPLEIDCMGPISGNALLMDIIECLKERKSRNFHDSPSSVVVSTENGWDQLRCIAEATNLPQEIVRRTIATWPLAKRRL